jgi:hypothetical protein
MRCDIQWLLESLPFETPLLAAREFSTFWMDQTEKTDYRGCDYTEAPRELQNFQP